MTTVRKVHGVRNDEVETYVIYHFNIGIHFCVKTQYIASTTECGFERKHNISFQQRNEVLCENIIHRFNNGIKFCVITQYIASTVK